MRTLPLLAIAAFGCANDIERIPGDDDERLDALGIVCESTIAITGSFVESEPQPSDSSGCWGIGEWIVMPRFDAIGCSPQPSIADLFRYRATADEDGIGSNVEWLDDPDSGANLNLVGDGGICAGRFEHVGVGNARATLSLQPVLEADGTLTGSGVWTLYSSD